MSVAHFEEGGPPPVGPQHALSVVPPARSMPVWAWGKEPKKALLQVAHPDDETIFAGGLMLAFPEWEWHVVAMTGAEERRSQLTVATECFKRAGVDVRSVRCYEFEDRYRPADRRLWLARCAQEDTTSWDIVLTHGFRGEYGHHHHVWLNHIAHLLYENVWDFFQPGCEKVPQLLKTQVIAVETDSRKVEIFDYAYGHIAKGLREFQPELIAPMECGQREFFTQAVLGL